MRKYTSSSNFLMSITCNTPEIKVSNGFLDELETYDFDSEKLFGVVEAGLKEFWKVVVFSCANKSWNG